MDCWGPSTRRCQPVCIAADDMHHQATHFAVALCWFPAIIKENTLVERSWSAIPNISYKKMYMHVKVPHKKTLQVNASTKRLCSHWMERSDKETLNSVPNSPVLCSKIINYIMFSFGQLTGAWVLIANDSEFSISSIFIDRTMKYFIELPN